MDVAAVRLEHRLLARQPDVLLELRLRRVVHLLDPGRVDPPVLDQLLERHLRELAPQPVEGREHDRLGCVVDDEVDPGQVLERADVAALAADDPTLHVVGGERDDRDRRLGGVARRDALQCVGDEVARAPPRLAARLLLELARRAARARAGSGPRSARADGALPRRPSGPAIRSSSFTAPSFALFSSSWSCRTCTSRSFSPCSRRATSSALLPELHFSGLRALLDLGDRGAPVGDLLLDLGPKPDRLLAGLDLRFAPDRLRLARAPSRRRGVRSRSSKSAAASPAPTTSPPSAAITVSMAVLLPSRRSVSRGRLRRRSSHGCSHPALGPPGRLRLSARQIS